LSAKLYSATIAARIARSDERRPRRSERARTHRQPIGFKLKGFKNFYLRYVRKSTSGDRADFLKLVNVLEKAIELAGNRVFEHEDARSGYEEARKIATEDDAALHELPNVA
jgi:hypothetical protein